MSKGVSNFPGIGEVITKHDDSNSFENYETLLQKLRIFSGPEEVRNSIRLMMNSVDDGNLLLSLEQAEVELVERLK